MKPVPGFSGYEITQTGLVRSKSRMGTRGGWLRPHINHAGRLVVDLCERGHKKKTCLVHRLVLEAFVGPCPPGMEACHNNGIKTDNRLGNLRWDTKSANAMDAVRHGTHAGFLFRGERNGSARLTALDARWIEYLRRAGVSRKDLAEVYQVSPSLITHIALHRAWRHLWA